MCGILRSIKIKNKMIKNLHSPILSNNPNDLINDVNQRYKTYRNVLNHLVTQKGITIIKYLLKIEATQKRFGKLLIYYIILKN